MHRKTTAIPNTESQGVCTALIGVCGLTACIVQSTQAVCSKPRLPQCSEVSAARINTDQYIFGFELAFVHCAFRNCCLIILNSHNQFHSSNVVSTHKIRK